MEIRKFNEVEGMEGLKDWEIVNAWGNTRNGFKHVSTLFHYGNEVCQATCCYLNRTWECYSYQTSMRAVVQKRITEIKNRIVDNYKQENTIARLSPKHKDAIQKLEDENQTIKELQEIYKQLDFSR